MAEERLDQHESEESSAGNSEKPLRAEGSSTEGYHTHRDDMPNSATIAERKRLRTEVADEIEAFLQGGGSITTVDDNVRADPPRKPESNYGSRPI